MTTPAVNVNRFQTSTGTSRTYNYVTGVISNVRVYSGINVRHFQETRPASQKVVPTADGWRQPTAWNHKIEDNTLCPTSPFEIWTPPGQTSSTQYFDGAGWNQTSGGYDPIGNIVPITEIKALNKLKNQKVNLAQAFAEREQTARLMIETTRRIAKAINAYRSKNPKKIWDAIVKNEGNGKSVPNNWLELQYGWRPLLADVKGSCDELQARDFNGKTYRVAAKAITKRPHTYTWEKKTDVHAGFGILVKSRAHTICKVRLDYVLENPFAHTLASTGITNPLLIAWELMPWSFVYDWVSPVGNWISTLDASVGFDFLGGTCSVFQVLNESGTTWFNHGNVGRPLGAANYFLRARNLTRTVYTSSPLPRFPGLKNPFSSKEHIANALALLWSSLH